MKRPNFRRIFCLLLSVLLLQTVSCTAGKTEETKPVSPSVANVPSYEKESLPKEENFYSEGTLCRAGDAVYLIGSTDGAGTMLIYDIADDTVRYEPLPESYTNIRALAVCEDGYYVFYEAYDEISDIFTYKIAHIRDGAEVSERPLSNDLTLPDHFYGDLCALGTGSTLCFAASTKFVVLSGDKTFVFDLPGEVTQLCEAPSGEVYVLGNNYLSVYDPVSGTLTEDTEKSAEIALLNAEDYYTGEGYDLYYSNLNGLYGYHFGSGTPETVFSWVGSGLYYERMEGLVPLEAGHFLLYGTTDRYGEPSLMSLRPREEDEIERQVITVSYVENGRGTIPMAAIRFNQSQSEYEIVCEEYVSAAGGDYTTAMNQLDAAILTGDLADILILESREEVDKYGKLGLLLDLYTVMEDREDLFRCIREYCETDGALYGITPEFTVSTLIVKEENLPEADVWNSTAFLDTVETRKKGQHLFAGWSRPIVERWVLSSVIWEFLNTESMTCSFETPEFARVLDFLASVPEDYTTAYEDEGNHYGNDDILFLSDSPSCFVEYLRVKALFGMETPIRAVGYPSENGGVATITPMSFCAISANCEHTEGAYAFVNYLLSGECVIDENRGMQKISASRTTLAGWAESEGKLYHFIPYDDVNRMQTSLEPIQTNEAGVQVRADDALIREFSDWIDDLRPARNLPEDIRLILSEELSSFYGGVKNAEDTARVIQSRVSIWLAEHQR